jgi:predicted NBD/HSP70 family sugar kinase
MKKNILAIDIGGTKIEICKFDNNYDLISYNIIPTANLAIGSFEFIDGIREIIADNLDKEVSRIGISFNCSINEGNIIFSSLMGGLINYPLEEKFSKEFKIPVKIINDVNAMALTENRFGPSKDAHSFVLINLGTGLRISFVHRGNLIGGYLGNAGEISLKRIMVSELADKILKLEDVVSGAGLQCVYREISGIEKGAMDIFKSTDLDGDAKKSVDIFCKYLAMFLEEVSYFYNPEKIIINGSVKKSAEFFLPQVTKQYQENTGSLFQAREIVISKIDHSACLGSVII